MLQMNMNVFFVIKGEGVAKIDYFECWVESIWCLEVRQEPVISTNPSAEKLH
jgi:hypothetical protein